MSQASPDPSPQPKSHLKDRVLEAMSHSLQEGPAQELALMRAFQWLCIAANELQDLSEWPWKHEGNEARLSIHLDRQRQELRIDLRLRGKGADSLLLSAGFSDLNGSISPMVTWQRDHEVGRADGLVELQDRLSRWLSGYLRPADVMGFDGGSYLGIEAEGQVPVPSKASVHEAPVPTQTKTNPPLKTTATNPAPQRTEAKNFRPNMELGG